VGHCVCKRKVGEGVWTKKSKPSRRGSISGAPYETAKGDGAEGWCGGVYEVAVAVGLCAHETRGKEEGFGPKPKTQNRAVVARFRVPRVKWQQGMVRSGGVVVHTRRWWWWWSCALAKWEPEMGVGPKPKTEPLWLDLGRAM
jgi:hypothetical protein